MTSSHQFPESTAAHALFEPFTPSTAPPPRYLGGVEAFRRLIAAGLPACVTDALAVPCERGTLGLFHDPVAFDPLVYLAFSSWTGELIYVGRTRNLPARIARHRRHMQSLGGRYPDLWAAVRIPGPDAAHVEEGLMRHFQSQNHPAQLNVRRGPYASGSLVSGQQRDAMERHGFLPE